MPAEEESTPGAACHSRQPPFSSVLRMHRSCACSVRPLCPTTRLTTHSFYQMGRDCYVDSALKLDTTGVDVDNPDILEAL